MYWSGGSGCDITIQYPEISADGAYFIVQVCNYKFLGGGGSVRGILPLNKIYQPHFLRMTIY